MFSALLCVFGIACAQTTQSGAAAGKAKKNQTRISMLKNGNLRVANTYISKGISLDDCDGANCSITSKGEEVQGEHILVYNKNKTSFCQLKFTVNYLGSHVSYEVGNSVVFIDEYKTAVLTVGDMEFDYSQYKILGSDKSKLDTPYCGVNKNSVKVNFIPAGNSVVKSSKDYNVVGRGYASEVTVPVKVGGETKNIVFLLDPAGQKFASDIISNRNGTESMRHFAQGVGEKPKFEAYRAPKQKVDYLLEMHNKPL